MQKEEKETKRELDSEPINPVSEPSLNMDELKELADLIEERGFTDFEFENEKIRVRMSKNITPAVPQTIAQPSVPVQSPTSTGETAPAQISESPEPESETGTDDGLSKINSPIVGTFYRAPGPDKEPFVKEGDQVNEDSTVCIVEAMKLMNEIQAEVSGEIVKVYVENGQPVEYGQPLFGIKN